MTERGVLKILEKRHRDRGELFVCQCRTVGSHAKYFIMDGWADNRAGSRCMTVGYEVKVYPGDFLRDGKWHEYLPYCNKFYFVVPHGMIDQVPDPCGLMWVAKNGTRAYVKKQAGYRETDAATMMTLYRYLAVSRPDIFLSHVSDSAEYWESWLERRGSLRELGRRVSKRIREKYLDEHEDLRKRTEEAEQRIAALTIVETFCRKSEINLSDPVSGLEWKTKKALRCVPDELSDDIAALRRDLATFERKLAELRDKTKSD